jgi:hypothetical protein
MVIKTKGVEKSADVVSSSGVFFSLVVKMILLINKF